MGARRDVFIAARAAFAALALAATMPAACARPLSSATEAARDGGAGGAAGTPGMVGGGGTCAARAGDAGAGGGLGTQCTDGLDNDGDGKTDYDDPECVGGLDNDESSFSWGIPDDAEFCTTDCFFDGNGGMGDDGCRWQLKCDPASTYASCPYDAAYAVANPEVCSLSASQTQTCLDRCMGLVPNGCDCFGCCAVPGVATPVRLWATCTAADFANPQKCPPCTQVTQCLNSCERCEICIGKPTLPDDCATPDGCAPYICPAGAPACGAHGIAPWRCPTGTSCVTGCCLPLNPVL